MAFWKKSEDPWDRKPEKKPEKKQSSVPESRKGEAPVREQEDGRPAPTACPWCGKPMLAGNLYCAGRSLGMYWSERPSRSFLESFGTAEQPRRLELSVSEEACYCTACQKLVLDVGAALKRSGPNYIWKNGRVVLPDDANSEERDS